MKKHTLSFHTRKEAKGYSAQCIEFPSIITQADTKKELDANITDAVNGYFEAFPDEKEKLDAINIGNVIKVTI